VWVADFGTKPKIKTFENGHFVLFSAVTDIAKNVKALTALKIFLQLSPTVFKKIVF
jgi:hypothetical protein